ncbi:MAG: replicative DNA helicase [Alphaproteobacteria bacterium]
MNSTAAVAAIDPRAQDRAEDEPAYRSPPANTEIEIALLGAILVNNRAYEKVSEFLLAEHFADRAHGRIFEACGKLIERGQQATPATLRRYFENDADLTEVGGARYLAEIAAAAFNIIDAEDYGRTLYDLHLRRSLIELGQDVVNEAFGADLDSNAVQQIEKAEHRLFELASTGQMEGGFQEFGRTLVKALQMAESAFRREGMLTGVTTGLEGLDRLLGGLQRSDLVILAGRPGMGKTALATNIAFNAARAAFDETDERGNRTRVEGHIVALFSLEMSAEQLALRILAEHSGVSSDRVRRGAITGDEFQKVFVASQEIARSRIFIDDTPALSVSALRTRCRRLLRTQGRLDMIVVDYIQLMRGSPGARQENRVQEISEITRGLKGLAKELDVPVLALSQLSRAVEQREDKRPQLADLRESGSIEQDADVVMFVFREEYYLGRKEPAEGTAEHAEWQAEMDKVHNMAEVIVAKQRHGPTDKVRLLFEAELTRFGNLAPTGMGGDVPF